MVEATLAQISTYPYKGMYLWCNRRPSVPPTVLAYECADLAAELDESVYSNMLLLFLVF